MNRCTHSRPAVLVGALLLMLSATGCDALLDTLSGTYRGPFPSEESLTVETVIVREVYPFAGEPSHLLVDRVRYLEGGRRHDVNRIVQVRTERVQNDVAALGLKVGDRVVVSTEFSRLTEKGQLTSVPDWPGHGYVEYPVAEHHLTAVARVAP